MVIDSWGIKEVLRNIPTKPRTEARSIHQVSRSYRGCRAILDRSTKYRDTYRGRCQEMVVDSWGIEEQLIKTKNRIIDPPGVEKQSWMQTHSWSIHQVSRSCRDCDKKMLKKLDKQEGIKEVSSQLLKPVFRDVKKTNMNGIQHATQSMIQSTY